MGIIGDYRIVPIYSREECIKTTSCQSLGFPSSNFTVSLLQTCQVSGNLVGQSSCYSCGQAGG